MIPWSLVNSALTKAWASYWEFKDSDPVKAEVIRETILIFTRGLR